jgi:hypothetical protein
LNQFFKVISLGPNKGKRIYYENLCGIDQVWSVEIYYLLLNTLKLNYKIFYFNSKSIHNIKIPDDDLNFLYSYITSDTYENYNFSKEVIQIKNLQEDDIKKLYNLSVKTGDVGGLFTYPSLKSNFYCFDFFLIIKNDFDLNSVLNLDFNLIKIHSVIEYNENNLSLEFIQRIYNIPELKFKDYVVLYQDLRKTRPHPKEYFHLIPEYKKLMDLKDLMLKYTVENNTSTSPFDNEILQLEEIVSIKESELTDREFYKKLFFTKLCCQFWIFREDVLSDSTFFTDFYELTGVAVLNTDKGNNIITDYNFLFSSSLTDIQDDDYYNLFSVFQHVFPWRKK